MQNYFENEAFVKFFGKKKTSWVCLWMGLGVTSSQLIASSSCFATSATNFDSNEKMKQMQAKIVALEAQVAQVDL